MNVIISLLLALFSILLYSLFSDSGSIIRFPAMLNVEQSESSKAIAISVRNVFQEENNNSHDIIQEGVFLEDRQSSIWSWFANEFGANPSSFYFWYMFPTLNGFFYTPFWHLDSTEAVIFVGQTPPECIYYSFTTFSLISLSHPVLMPFASIADAVNNREINQYNEKFVHIVTGDPVLAEDIGSILIKANIVSSTMVFSTIIPTDMSEISFGYKLYDTFFETVLRVFHFHDNNDDNEGNKYINTRFPVFKIRKNNNNNQQRQDIINYSGTGYLSRSNINNINETLLYKTQFNKFQVDTIQSLSGKVHIKVPFNHLDIQGQRCLKEGSCCLGDCPDASYFGPNISVDNDEINTFKLNGMSEYHIIIGVNHEYLNTSIYNSIAILQSKTNKLSKRKMRVRNTGIGVTNLKYQDKMFYSWVFTLNQTHCDIISSSNGCTVLQYDEINPYFTYCERVYVNPVTNTGPDYRDIIPALLVHIKL